MTDFSTLEPETRCIALVGEFLRRWSGMEAVLNETIAKAMNIDETMRLILCANVQLRDKVNILRAIISVSTIKKTEGTMFSDMVGKISDYSLNRNMMAHDTFRTDADKKGVLFLQVKAKKNFSQPQVVWTIDTFNEAYQQIELFQNQLIKLQEALSNSKFSFTNVDWNNQGVSSPMPRTMSAALMDFLSRQPPLVLVANQPNHKQDD